VFERSPWVAEAAFAGRPFATLEALHAAMVSAVEAAPEAARLELVRAHPDLGSRLRMSAESTAEQAGAGLDRLDPVLFERFAALNRAYTERFGFPFVIAVRDHSREQILAAFERRLAHTGPQELAAALEQVSRIARHRLQDLVGEGTP
jgi:OHCU decarboxylase